MRKLVLLAAALVFTAPAFAEFDSDAVTTLGKGKWGLITSDLSEAAVAEARKCEGTSISFAFTANEIQRITFEAGQPPKGPPDFFGDVTVNRAKTSSEFQLFAAKGDAKPVAVYTYDPSVDTLMLMDADGDGTALYALCS